MLKKNKKRMIQECLIYQKPEGGSFIRTASGFMNPSIPVQA
jgi:hypothetical protein